MNPIKHLARRKSSGVKSLKEKRLRWNSKTAGSAGLGGAGLPGDSKRAAGAPSRLQSTSSSQAVLSAAADGAGINPNDALHLVALYVSQLGFDRALATKVLRKFRRHGLPVEDAIRERYQKYRDHEDAACIEDLVLQVLPLKNRISCLRQLYINLLRYNDFFRALTRAVPADELLTFETKLLQSLRRETIFPNRYLAVAPRGAIYLVRRGAVRISMKGTVVATLEQGAVFEVCVLSDHYVTIHRLNGNASARGLHLHTNSAFDVIEPGAADAAAAAADADPITAAARRRQRITGVDARALVERSGGYFDEADDEDDDDEEEDDEDDDYDENCSFGCAVEHRSQRRTFDSLYHMSLHDEAAAASAVDPQTDAGGDAADDVDDATGDSESAESGDAMQHGASGVAAMRGSSANRRRSLANAFKMRHKHIGDGPLGDPQGVNASSSSHNEALDRGHRAPVHPADKRRSLAIKADRLVETYPFNAVNICAVEVEATLDNLLPTDGAAHANKYMHGCELGVLTYDTLRSLVAQHPSVARNLEVLQVSVEVQVEKEALDLRRRQELTRRKLELEHRQATNRELERACRAGSVQRVHEAVVAGASFTEGLDETGATALHLAAIFGHTEVVSLLLRLGASPCVKDRDERTPLHLCCLVGAWDQATCKTLVSLLSQHNACLQERDKWGNTPVHLAASTGDRVLLSIFMNELTRKADASSVLTLRNEDGFTALELCTGIDSRRILKPKTHIIANVR